MKITIIILFFFLTCLTMILGDDISSDQSVISTSTAQPDIILANRVEDIDAFEWLGDDKLIIHHTDGDVSVWSREDNSVQKIGDYPVVYPYKIALAVSPDSQYLAVGSLYTIDIFHQSETSKFKLSGSIQVSNYVIETLDWHKDNTALAVSGLNAVAAGYYEIVSVNNPVAETYFLRGYDPIWQPDGSGYAVLNGYPMANMISIFNTKAEKTETIACVTVCRRLSWHNDGRWLGIQGEFSEQGYAFLIVDTQNMPDETHPILLGESNLEWCGHEQIIAANGEVVRLWDFDEGETTFIQTLNYPVYRVKCSPDGRFIALLDRDNTLKVIENPSRD